MWANNQEQPEQLELNPTEEKIKLIGRNEPSF